MIGTIPIAYAAGLAGLGSIHLTSLQLEELFLTAIGRTPTQEEVDVAQRIMQANRNQGASDILWALLNTPEFLLNY